MPKTTIDPQDSMFLKHAVYIFQALQSVQSCVVIDGLELAAQPGYPQPTSIQMQISRIANRWGLNMKTTLAGSSSGGRTPSRSPNKSPNKSPKTPRTSKVLKSKMKKLTPEPMRSIPWHEASDSDSAPATTAEAEQPVRKSSRTPKPKAFHPDFIYFKDDPEEDEQQVDDLAESVDGEPEWDEAMDMAEGELDMDDEEFSS